MRRRPTLREMMIAEGVIRPAELVPDHVGEGLPFLPIDGEGARQAAAIVQRQAERRRRHDES
ncbi:MAG: hypothetical protein JNL21_27675 [Myxococcales bacterium]|nr:hypothetical protein [Myxococcales bacterium]